MDPLTANVEVRVKEVQPVKLRSNASGEFETKLPEIKEYTVSANADGFLPKEQTFKVPELGNDTTLMVNIMLQPIAKKLLTGWKCV